MASFDDKNKIDEKEFRTMQAEAVRRVQEMQRRSQSYINRSSPRQPEKPIAEPQASAEPRWSPRELFEQEAVQANTESRTHIPHSSTSNGIPNANFSGPSFFGNTSNNQTQSPTSTISNLLSGLFSKTQSTGNGLLGGLLDDFKLDEEKIILGVLIYILAKNGGDLKLLLGLGYLLL